MMAVTLLSEDVKDLPIKPEMQHIINVLRRHTST